MLRMRVVVAFDSFKGSLSAREANEAFARGFCDVVADADVVAVPISDGGEGLSECVGGVMVEARASDPLGRAITTRYAVRDDTAVIALASASGLTLLTPSERDPLVTNTFGTGELLRDAVERGCRKIILGLGGSATNDCATGMLRALGFRFLDAAGVELTTTIDILEHTEHIKGCASLLRGVNVAVAVDVDNPLCGARGAAEVYARQKGATDADVERLDRAARHFAGVVARTVAADYSAEQGMGAAGGAAFGLRALLGVRPTSGIDLMLNLVNFDALVEGADLVVTGEGCVDKQTVMGKAPSGVLRYALRHDVCCIAVGGGVRWCDELRHSGFTAIYAATPDGMPLSEAMHRDTAYHNLRSMGATIALKYKNGVM